MYPRFLAICALLLLAALSGAQPPFAPVGIGGGGAMYVPACSPHDHHLMFVSCDMGGVYRSVNAGLTWQMLDKRELRAASGCAMAFDPQSTSRIFAASGSVLKTSEDSGVHWHASPGPWKEQSIVALAVGQGGTLFVGTGNGAWHAGKLPGEWIQCAGVEGAVIGFAFDERPGKNAAFIGTRSGIFRSEAGRWRVAGGGFSGIESFCGGSDSATGQLALYCALPGRNAEGKYVGGIYLSTDEGDSWQSAMGEGINQQLRKADRYGIDEIAQYQFLSMARGKPGTLFATTRGTGFHPPFHWTVYRTDDFGKIWRHCFSADPREPARNVEDGWLPLDINLGFGGPANGFSVCGNDPEIAMFTNNAELYITRDGAKSWQNAYSLQSAPGSAKPGQAWQSRGLEVTSCWHLDFEPGDPLRAYICYTDIGFGRSEDGGKSWKHSVEGTPWANSFYQIAFDPKRSGVIYAACANQHDIPTWTNVDKVKAGGGIAFSDDHGRSWRPMNKGLPDAPVTSVVLDSKSPEATRVLYAAVFGHGIYKSEDGGTLWRESSSGLGLNRHVYALKLHSDGTLFCTVTAKRDGRNFQEGSGLYVSKDGGSNWSLISPPLKWAGDCDFDPNDSRILYLAAATAPGHSEGGLYKTTDGGAHWRRLIKDADLPAELNSYIQAFFVSVDPHNPSRIYFSAQTHGLFVSGDAGETWKEVPGIPFTAVNRVAFDPVDAETIWVTTFGGGVWKGSPGL